MSFIVEKNASLVTPTPAAPDYAVCSNTIINDFGGGLGTLAFPYLICNIQQWNYFATTTNTWDKHIKLTADLDFTGIAFADLKMLSDGILTFTGNFDGGNKKILNITVNSGASAFALFGKTSASPTIKNLTIENLNLTTTSATSATLIESHAAGGTLTLDNVTLRNATFSKAVGGLVYQSLGGMNVTHVNLYTISMPVAALEAGLVVDLEANSNFSDIIVDGITMLGGGFFLRRGALVAATLGGAAGISVSFTRVTITNMTIGGSSSSYFNGGLIGDAYDTALQITDCSVSGTIWGLNSGGLIGAVETISSGGQTFTALRNSVNVNFTDCGNGLCGGLTSWLQGTTATIDKAVVRGNTTMWTGNVGGLIGQVNTNLTMNDSYFIGDLTKTGGSGVVAGLIAAVSSGTTTINRSYYSGALTLTGGAGPSLGCIVGRNFGTLNITDSYFNSTTCTYNAVNSGGYAGATGLATVALQTATPFTNWLLTDWIFSAAQNPKLLWEP